MAYQIDLDIYAGPLDLLLYLIEKEEVDIYDIPISRILSAYLGHLEEVKQLDINLAAEFLVMASTLMEIKSGMLLPVEDRAPDAPDDEEDPRGELVRQLLAFRAFKEAATNLGEMQEIRSRRYGRGYPIRLVDEGKPHEPEPLTDANLYDLGSAYAKLVKQTLGSGPRTIIYDEMSMEERVAAIRGVLDQRVEFALDALFADGKNIYDKVGTFFALLEMVRDHFVRIYQVSEFGQILVKRWEELPEGAPEPPGAHVEPSLPQPTAIPTEENARGFRMRGAAQFDGFNADDETPDEPGAFDDPEMRLNRRIDDILRRADEISERFEASRAGRLRGDGDEVGTSAGLDSAMAALDDEIGPLPDDPPAPGAAQAGDGAGTEPAAAPGASSEGGSPEGSTTDAAAAAPPGADESPPDGT